MTSNDTTNNASTVHHTGSLKDKKLNFSVGDKIYAPDGEKGSVVKIDGDFVFIKKNRNRKVELFHKDRFII